MAPRTDRWSPGTDRPPGQTVPRSDNLQDRETPPGTDGPQERQPQDRRSPGQTDGPWDRQTIPGTDGWPSGLGQTAPGKDGPGIEGPLVPRFPLETCWYVSPSALPETTNLHICSSVSPVLSPLRATFPVYLSPHDELSFVGSYHRGHGTDRIVLFHLQWHRWSGSLLHPGSPGSVICGSTAGQPEGGQATRMVASSDRVSGRRCLPLPLSQDLECSTQAM